MKKQYKDLLFLNRTWPVRIWMWSAVACLIFYLLKYSFISAPGHDPNLIDMGLMAYGVGSIAVYLLIYGFDWS